jgi:hypothetical protein
MISSGTSHCVSDVSENISPPSSDFHRLAEFHICVGVESLLISLSIEGYNLGLKNAVILIVFTAVNLINVFWDFVVHDSS